MPPRVRIVTPKKAIRVNYDVVREMVPTLWDNDDDASTSAEAPATTEAATPRSDEQQQQQQSTTDKTTTPHPPTNGKDKKNKYDFVLHIGMAGPQPVYQIERRGHRDGYRLRDVDGNLLGDEERHRAEGDRWIWHGVPHELLTDLDIEGVYRRWVARSPVSLLVLLLLMAFDRRGSFIHHSSDLFLLFLVRGFVNPSAMHPDILLHVCNILCLFPLVFLLSSNSTNRFY